MFHTTSRTVARRFASVSVGAALALSGLAGSALAADDIANPEPDPCEQLDLCGGEGPIDPQPEPDDDGFDGPGDFTDDPCHQWAEGCGGEDTPDDDEGIDEVTPDAPVPADPTFTG